jgi:beta-ureidopropionase
MMNQTKMGDMTCKLKTLEECLKTVPEADMKDMRTHIFGRADDNEQAISKEGQQIAKANNFVMKAYKIDAIKEDLRKPRIVKIGAVQHSLAAPTSDPVHVQCEKGFEKVGKMIEAAAAEDVNILCFQELWTLPYVFCTREKYPWCEFAENAMTGPSTSFLCNYAKKFNMVIVSPILERDEDQGDIVWDTAVVISNSGKVIGKHRKNHIPRENDFNESTYYVEGNTGHPVFETQFGKIAINICYGRHHPQNWMMFGLNGADIVFNPSAEISGSLSDHMWFIEGRAAAVANSFFTVTINRVGVETYGNEFTSGDGKKAHKSMGYFYGSSYLAAPDGTRTPALPRDKDGILITEVDLNMCRQERDIHTFRMCQRLPLYAEGFTKATKLDFKPQIVKEN